MDSGKFESMSRVGCSFDVDVIHYQLNGFWLQPYGFHHVMRSLFVPLQLATNARGLQFETDLDPNIDIVSQCLP